MADPNLDAMVAEILAARKYRELGISPETVRDLLEKELRQAPRPKEAVKAVRQKLHNIVAPYLGDPDYPAAVAALAGAFASGSQAAVRQACLDILATHSSTRERIPLLEQGFYERIFAVTGRPGALIDAACGLNPFTLPWMELEPTLHYHAYDIHGPRVALINQFFAGLGLEPLAEQRDVLVDPPGRPADVALIFKEAHRMEQRQRGSSAALWDALRVRWLAVSLPTHSLTGRYDLVERQRALVRGILGDRPWPVTEVLLENELVFCIEKPERYGEA